jgi:hypothetical protein
MGKPLEEAIMILGRSAIFSEPPEYVSPDAFAAIGTH